MFRVSILMCLIASYVLDAANDPGFVVKYNYSPIGIGTQSFISLPIHIKSAEALKWIQVQRPPGPLEYSSFDLFCPVEDYTICVLYDDTGFAAGMQIGLDLDLLSGLLFDMPTIGFTMWNTIIQGRRKRFWTLQQYYVSPEHLAFDSASRIASRDPSKFIQGTDVYLSGPLKKITKVSTDPKKFDPIFKRQTCIDGMGMHFYYNITPAFECMDGNMFPWFTLVDEDQLIGIGMLTYGHRRVPTEHRDWLEVYPGNAIEYVLRDKVPCLWELGAKKQLMALHTYFVERPFDIKSILFIKE